jgi:methylaspartate mutase epsilon subunit
LAPGLPPIDEIVGYVRQLSKQSMAICLANADSIGEPLIQARSGVASQEKMIELLRIIDGIGHADCLTLTIDSHTRLLKLETAQRLLREAPDQLNGYPLVAHGYPAVRRLNELFEKPIQVRHGSPDGRRLFAESLAGGICSYEGGGISYNLPYSRNISLQESLDAWREVDEACGQLNELGIVVDREFFGSLSGVLVPPAIALSVVFLEAILAAREGCRCLSLAYPQSGNIVQDIAALKTIRVLAKMYLPDTAAVYPVFHQFMGVFPVDAERAETLIFFGGLTARIGRATKIISKTSQEAIGIPDAQVNAAGVRRTRLSFEKYLSLMSADPMLVADEAYWIERETRELIDPVLSKPDLIHSIVDAFRSGELDVPFPSNREACGRVIPVRDRELAIRFANAGKLPFSKETRERNDDKLKSDLGQGRTYERVRDSIMHFSR